MAIHNDSLSPSQHTHQEDNDDTAADMGLPNPMNAIIENRPYHEAFMREAIDMVSFFLCPSFGIMSEESNWQNSSRRLSWHSNPTRRPLAAFLCTAARSSPKAWTERTSPWTWVCNSLSSYCSYTVPAFLVYQNCSFTISLPTTKMNMQSLEFPRPSYIFSQTQTKRKSRREDWPETREPAMQNSWQCPRSSPNIHPPSSAKQTSTLQWNLASCVPQLYANSASAPCTSAAWTTDSVVVEVSCGSVMSEFLLLLRYTLPLASTALMRSSRG